MKKKPNVTRKESAASADKFELVIQPAHCLTCRANVCPYWILGASGRRGCTIISGERMDRMLSGNKEPMPESIQNFICPTTQIKFYMHFN